MKVKVFFHVYPDEASEENGEYITYQGDWLSGADLLKFVGNVRADILERVNLLAEGKSMLTGDLNPPS